MNIIIGILALILTSATSADVIVVKIPGLVCSSCGIGIKKHLKKTKKVESVEFDVNKQLAFIDEIENKTLSDKEVKTAIINAGYEIGPPGIQRNQNEK